MLTPLVVCSGEEWERVVSALLERAVFSLDVVLSPEIGTSARLFRWQLTSSKGQQRLSPETFATRREAMREGEVQLERARQRGRIAI